MLMVCKTALYHQSLVVSYLVIQEHGCCIRYTARMSWHGHQSSSCPLHSVIRFVFGLGGLVVITSTFTSYCTTLTHLLAATAAVGVCYSVAFGTSYQLVARFSPACTVALTTGGCALAAVETLHDYRK